MESKNRISAKEAREIADTSSLVLNRLYKQIRDLAKEGETELYWTLSNPSEKLMATLKKTFEQDGYKVIYVCPNEELNKDIGLQISW